MAGILNLVYAAAAGLVAIAGVAYVLNVTTDPVDRETVWSDLSLTAAVAIFVVAMLWSII